VFWRRRRSDEDFADEISAHLANEIDRLVEDGLSRDEATVRARRAFGNVTRARETYYDARRFVLLDQFTQDLRYAWRGLWHSRAFVATTVLTLAVGMGLVTVVFAVFNAYVLRPFAVHDPYSLHQAEWRAKEAGGSSFRWRDYEDFRARTDLFDGVIAETRRTVTMGDRQLSVGFVSGNYFEMLGPRVALGRGLVESDGRSSGSEPVIVLTDPAWARLFDRDPAIVGREIDISGQRLVVVGVMAPEFSGMDEVPRDAWVPITMHSVLLMGDDPLAPNDRRLQLTVRLRGDVTRTLAESAVPLEPFETQVVGRRDQVGLGLTPRPTPVRMTQGQLALLSPVFLAFALVLVAACANASNVMLARTGARHREIGIRLSIGASRGRVVRQLLTEGLLIASLAGAFGLALASVLRQVGAYFFVVMLPPTVAARVQFVPFDFDHRVFTFTMIVACGVTMLFALLPALQATRISLTDALRGQLTSTIRSSVLRGLLVTSQVTVSLVLLIFAGTLVRNGAAIRGTNIGVDTSGVISARGSNSNGLVRRAYDELASDSRVGEIAVASRSPLFGQAPPAPIRRPTGLVFASYAFVSPEYFNVFRIPILHGRSFSAEEAATEAPIAIVSAAGARALWPGEDPIGKTVRVNIEPVKGKVVADTVRSLRVVGELDATATEVTIVGVAQDVINGFVYQGIDPAYLYLPTHPGSRRATTVILRGRGPLQPGPVRSSLLRVSPDPMAFDVLAVDEMVALQLFPLRVASWIGSLLSAVALALSISGLYGVLAYLFGQRIKEIGVRMALGASPGAVRRLVFHQAARLSAAGTLLGLLAAFGVMKLLSSFVHLDNVSVVDPVAFAASVFLIGIAVALASYGPARKAARVDPSTMLRTET
jgi:predicted permease